MFFSVRILALVAVFLSPVLANGQGTTKWIVNPMMEDFSDPFNWTDGVPTSGDIAIFDIGGPFKVVMDVDGVVANLDHLTGEMTLLGPKKLTVINDCELNTNINVAAGCVLACNTDLTIESDQDVEMLLSNSDTVLNVAGDIFLAGDTGTSGDMTVIGGSSVVADQIFVGANGQAELSVRSGGSIMANELIVADNVNSNAIACVEIGGQGIAVDTLVGSSSVGDLIVADNSVFMSTSIVCGNKPDGAGNITVVTNGEISAGNMVFGNEGSGGIVIGDGVVNADSVDLGLLPGSNGQILVFENGTFNCDQLNIGVSGSGKLFVWEFGSVAVAQTTTLASGSSICMGQLGMPNSGQLQCDGGIVAEGLIEFIAGTGRIVGDLTLQGDGEIEATEGQAEIVGNVIHNGARIFVFAQTELVIDGDYQGNGSMEGGGIVTILGALSPGNNDTGIIDLDVGVDLPSSSELKIEIGGTLQGQYDRIAVGSNLNINECELSVVMADGFVPEPGDSFLIADVGGNLNGTFANLPPNSFFNSDDGHPFQVIYDTTMDEVRIVAQDFGSPLLGDVNLDGVVDLLDVGPFVIVLTRGTYLAEADVNGDGDVDLLDVGPFIDILSN